jgi:hypothetical protein
MEYIVTIFRKFLLQSEVEEVEKIEDILEEVSCEKCKKKK